MPPSRLPLRQELSSPQGGAAPDVPVLGTTEVLWNGVVFTLDADLMQEGDVVEIQYQAAGGDWSSLQGHINHTVTASDVAAYHMDLTSIPVVGPTEARARHIRGASAWSATHAYTVPAQPVVAPPVLSFLGSIDGSANVRIAFDGSLGIGDILMAQLQAAGGGWTSIIQEVEHVISADDAAAGYYDYLFSAANAAYDVRAFGIKDGLTSASSNVVTQTINSPVALEYTGTKRYFQSIVDEHDDHKVTFPDASIGDPVYRATRRVYAVLTGGIGHLSSATIGGEDADCYNVTGSPASVSVFVIVTAVVPSKTLADLVITWGDGLFGGADASIYICDDTLLDPNVPPHISFDEQASVDGANTMTATIPILAGGALMIGTWFGGGTIGPTISASDQALTTDLVTNSSLLSAHGNNLGADSSFGVTVEATVSGAGNILMLGMAAIK